jgi:hypothetical protein
MPGTMLQEKSEEKSIIGCFKAPNDRYRLGFLVKTNHILWLEAPAGRMGGFALETNIFIV